MQKIQQGGSLATILDDSESHIHRLAYAVPFLSIYNIRLLAAFAENSGGKVDVDSPRHLKSKDSNARKNAATLRALSLSPTLPAKSLLMQLFSGAAEKLTDHKASKPLLRLSPSLVDTLLSHSLPMPHVH